MAVYKRGKYYWYKFVFQGRRIQRSTKLTNKVGAERAEAIHRARLAEARAGIAQRRPAPLFKEFVEVFLQTVRAERKPNTHRCYRTCVRSLLPWFGGKRLDEITATSIAQYKEARLRERLVGATVNRDLACLRRMFSIALKRDLVVTSPFAGRKVEFLPERNHERILSFKEERCYLAAANPLLYDVATLILEMGFRPEEIFQMRQEDVHLEARPPYIHVPAGKTKNAKRDLAITERAFEVLKRRILNSKGTYLFPLRVGNGFDWKKPMTRIQKAHEEALRKSGLKPAFRLYDLRHTFGTRAAEAGLNPLELMRLMGHADLKTTTRYVHLSKTHLWEAQRRIERYRVEKAFEEVAAQQPTAAAVAQ